MEDLLKIVSLLKDPALIAMVVVNYLLIRQNSKFIDVIDLNTKTLAELSTLINVLVHQNSGK